MKTPLNYSVRRPKVTAPPASGPGEPEMERIEHALTEEEFQTIVPVLQEITRQNDKLSFFLNHVIKANKLPMLPMPGYQMSEDGRKLIGVRPKQG